MLNNDYSATSRMLHKMVLSSPRIGELCYDIETAFSQIGASPCKKVEKPVFIAGLARAGTTILMRTLFSTGQFCSLSYRDMPFVLMPSLWRRLSTPFFQPPQNRERAHKDRIMVNYDSPEALEEIFWKTFCEIEYVTPEGLRSHEPNETVIAKYQKYVKNIVTSKQRAGQTRYLCKNNNNVLRLNAIAKAFPDAKVIIPFRDPIQQALSLQRQHISFLERHRQDPFSLNYMNWLGHHEFGSNHKPLFAASPVLKQHHHPESLVYWLKYWAHVYQQILEQAPANCLFFSYEAFCQSPTSSLVHVLDNLDIDCPAETIREISQDIVANRQSHSILPKALTKESYSVYDLLKKRSTQ